jgi:multidrug efflux pump subunit AcrA (membrane-fusion protein)
VASLHPQRTDLVTHVVQRERLQVTIVERGALESADNREVVARVRAGAKGSTVATTIKWVIDDGTHVKQGQLLCEFDDSGLQEQLKTQKIALDQARAAWISADENCKIVESQNESDIKTAEITLELAEIDLRKYLEGDYEQSKKDVDGRRLVADSDLEMSRDRAAWAERMVKKGYITASQAESERSRLQSARIALEKIQEEKRVLVDYTFKRTKTDLLSKVAEARRALDRVKKQARAKEVTAAAEMQAKYSVYGQEQVRFRDVESEIAKCTLVAPQDGLVVYYISDQSRFGSGSQQSIIAQGEPVREGQKLMRIPDLNHMLVNCRVHEAMISKVRGDVTERTGFGDCVLAGLMAVPPLPTRLITALGFGEIRPGFAEAHRTEEQRIVSDGQPALVRVDAFPDRILRGHVKMVATVASQQDWMSSDVKVYQTLVAVDEPMDGLKPGMSAEVTLFTDAKVDDVLTVPVQAILPAPPDGSGKPRAFVRLPDGSTEGRDVVTGLSNEKMVEIKSGVEHGEEVVLNPRSLLTDKERARAPVAADRTGSPKDATPEKGAPKPGVPNADTPGATPKAPSARDGLIGAATGSPTKTGG